MRWVNCKYCKYNESGECRNPKSENYKYPVSKIPKDGCSEGV